MEAVETEAAGVPLPLAGDETASELLAVAFCVVADDEIPFALVVDATAPSRGFFPPPNGVVPLMAATRSRYLPPIIFLMTMSVPIDDRNFLAASCLYSHVDALTTSDRKSVV